MNNEETILIVDDDSDFLALVERYASACGIQFKSAHSGAEALECLKTANISVVMTDMVMPGMDGMELLKNVKEHYPDIDVIVMTGYSKKYSYIDIIQAGGADFIPKPFKKDVFSAKLGRIFRERHLINELWRAKEKAEAGNKTKADFLRLISHELRTPMNAIQGFTSILSESDLPYKEMEYVEIVAQSANRLMKLIDQILDFSAIDADECDLKPCHFHLSDLLEEISITAKPRAKERGLRLNFEADDSLSETLLFGDRLCLYQVLNNLVDNALKFTDSGSIEIKAKGLKLPEDIIELNFSVQDSGCGIDLEKQTTIFEPFTQAEDYMTRQHEGAGLGLAICAKLTSILNGKIWLESQIGAGSNFHFTVRMGAV